MFEVIPQRPRHAADIEKLLDAAFGADRHAKTSYRYRDGVDDVADLRFVAVRKRRLFGTIRFWPIVIGDAAAPALLLGPLGVAPEQQGRGVGAALMAHGIAEAREKGHGIVLLVGDLTYYGRFGFGFADVHHITMPGESPRRVLVRELVNDALAGVSGEVRSLAAARETAAGGPAAA